MLTAVHRNQTPLAQCDPKSARSEIFVASEIVMTDVISLLKILVHYFNKTQKMLLMRLLFLVPNTKKTGPRSSQSHNEGWRLKAIVFENNKSTNKVLTTLHSTNFIKLCNIYRQWSCLIRMIKIRLSKNTGS